MKPSLLFRDIKGKAGQVAVRWNWRLSPETAAHCLTPYTGNYYSLVNVYADEWEIVAHPGCMWDYASGWFDFDYIKEASLGHDILHWLIARGHISEAGNAAIDEEFRRILVERGGLSGWRAAILKKAVGLCYQKKTGTDWPIIYLVKGKRL